MTLLRTRTIIAACMLATMAAITHAALDRPEHAIYAPPIVLDVRWVGATVVFSVDAVKLKECVVGGRRKPSVAVDRNPEWVFVPHRADGSRVVGRRTIMPGETLHVRGFRFEPTGRAAAGEQFTLLAPCIDEDDRFRVAHIGPIEMPDRGDQASRRSAE